MMRRHLRSAAGVFPFLLAAAILAAGHPNDCSGQTAPAKKNSPPSPHIKSGLGLEFDDARPKGVLKIKAVDPGGAAEKLGLRPGDVVFSAAGDPVKSKGDLAAVWNAAKPGEKVEFKVRRNNRIMAVAFSVPGAAEPDGGAEQDGEKTPQKDDETDQDSAGTEAPDETDETQGGNQEVDDLARQIADLQAQLQQLTETVESLARTVERMKKP